MDRFLMLAPIAVAVAITLHAPTAEQTNSYKLLLRRARLLVKIRV